MNPLTQTDYYKVGHKPMFPEHTKLVFDNFCPRKSRIEGVDSIVWFGLQYYIKRYLIQEWNREFFEQPLDKVIKKYKRRVEGSLGKDVIKYDHIEYLHTLGYLPLAILSLPEGTSCPIKVPPMVLHNTDEECFWLPNYLETSLSNSIWQASTSATLAREFRSLFNKAALETIGSIEGVQFQGHDFSYRGMSSLETACLSGAGHLLFFDGTDTIPAIDFLEEWYGANTDEIPFGFSVPATEHSVMCMGGKDDEIGTFKRLLDLFPQGILSVVSDTWNLWDVLTKFLPELKDKIMLREGKLVIRPDSGDPVDILCGNKTGEFNRHSFEEYKHFTPENFKNVCESKGVIELLWDVFGGTVNEQGYKLLDSHIGAIYGDSISIARANEINARLKAKGFASTNWVAGIGSYTYQYNTRDTFGWAMKATYGEVEVLREPTGYGTYPSLEIEAREIFKDPITDDGTKKSAKGLIAVFKDKLSGKLYLKDQATWHDVYNCEYKTVFLDGKLIKDQNFYDIRKIANENI